MSSEVTEPRVPRFPAPAVPIWPVGAVNQGKAVDSRDPGMCQAVGDGLAGGVCESQLGG